MKYLFFFTALILFSISSWAQVNTVEYCSKNKQVVGSNFEFDVYIRTLQNGTLLGSGVVYIDYNPLAFGYSVNGNGLTVIRDNINAVLGNQLMGPGFSIYIYSGSGLVTNNNSPTRFAVSWDIEQMAFAEGLMNQEKLLFRCRLPIINTSADRTVTFFEERMEGETFEVTGTSPTFTQTPFIVNLNCIILSVEGLELKAVALDHHQVQLDWTTLSEFNSKYFSLEKRHEREEFEEIGQVKAAGTTDQPSAYHWIDRTPMASRVIYRIRQVDFDGQFTYSNLVEINMPRQESPIVYPNPFSIELMLDFPNDLSGPVSFELYDLQGRQVILRKWTTTPSHGRIEAFDLPEGIYPYRIKAGGETWSGKVEKLSQ